MSTVAFLWVFFKLTFVSLKVREQHRPGSLCKQRWHRHQYKLHMNLILLLRQKTDKRLGDEEQSFVDWSCCNILFLVTIRTAPPPLFTVVGSNIWFAFPLLLQILFSISWQQVDFYSKCYLTVNWKWVVNLNRFNLFRMFSWWRESLLAGSFTKPRGF